MVRSNVYFFLDSQCVTNCCGILSRVKHDAGDHNAALEGVPVAGNIINDFSSQLFSQSFMPGFATGLQVRKVSSEQSLGASERMVKIASKTLQRDLPSVDRGRLQCLPLAKTAGSCSIAKYNLNCQI